MSSKNKKSRKSTTGTALQFKLLIKKNIIILTEVEKYQFHCII